MFKTILWATDGSEIADSALPFAKTLASGKNAELIVLHSNEIFIGGRATGLPVFADEEELQAKIDHQVDELRADGFDARFILVPSTSKGSAEVIADAARETSADVIVIGTHGHAPILGVVAGSVAQQLLHLAPCPVMVVPGADQRTKRGRRRDHEIATT
jgi:nucleotide-binding universal stress UspA family protein